MASPAYKAGKQQGIAEALGVATEKVTITGFSVSSLVSRRKARALATVSASVETAFEVEVADDTAATAMVTAIAAPATKALIQTKTNDAMVAQFASLGSAADAGVFTAAPSLTAAPTVATPTKATKTIEQKNEASSAHAASVLGTIAVFATSLALF